MACSIKDVLLRLFLIVYVLLYISEAKRLSICLTTGDIFKAKEVANSGGYSVVTRVNGLDDCYIFEKAGLEKRSESNKTHIPESGGIENAILSNLWVREAEVSIPRIRVKRSSLSAYSQTFSDPLFDAQWHLYNTEYLRRDLNVLPVWRSNITGHNVTVAILDDGVDYTHPDIKDNYDSDLSFDLLDDDNDPMPVVTSSDRNDHGTRCAGQVAAGRNSYCGLGVAFRAKIAAIRMLKYKVEDLVEAQALQFKRNNIDIYSSSWGPVDDGKKIDGPGLLVREAFIRGAREGRNGKGSIYVWASGNGGVNKDNCNCDGYCSSIYTITISAVNERGEIPPYVEHCTATLAAAYSSGGNHDRRIVTTDIDNACTHKHGGTSAAAPLASGVIALALSTNQNLTWRDVQHIIVETSEHLTSDCIINGAGRCVNNKIGFGILNSEAMVAAAKTWVNVPEQHICRIIHPDRDLITKDTGIRQGSKLMVQIETAACMGQSSEVAVLEHVEAVLSITHSNRGTISIELTSPNGTKSKLLTQRPSDKNSLEGFPKWTFMTVQMWGENPVGKWSLSIESTGPGSGTLTYFELTLYGTDEGSSSSRGPRCPVYTLTSRNGTRSCVDTCPTLRYYKVGARCLPCTSDCNTCNTANMCTSCPPDTYLLYEESRCIDTCPKGFSVTQSIVSGEICQRQDTKPWYKGDMMYIISIITFVVTLIIIVVIISIHHYRKHKNRRRINRFLPSAQPILILPPYDESNYRNGVSRVTPHAYSKADHFITPIRD